MGIEISSQDGHFGLWDQVQSVLKLIVELILGWVWAGLSWCVGGDYMGLDGAVDGEDCQTLRYWLEGDYATGGPSVQHKSNACSSFLAARVEYHHRFVGGW